MINFWRETSLHMCTKEISDTSHTLKLDDFHSRRWSNQERGVGDAGVANKHAHIHSPWNELKKKSVLRRVRKEHSSTNSCSQREENPSGCPAIRNKRLPNTISAFNFRNEKQQKQPEVPWLLRPWYSDRRLVPSPEGRVKLLQRCQSYYTFSF